jgi:hypothetical protein
MQDSLAMLLKTNGEKMSEYRPLAMLIKRMELYSFSRDVHERKESYAMITANVEQ